jgi:hypothetical protein
LSEISMRLKAIVNDQTIETGRFTELEKKTGIGRKTWQAWWTRESMPSGNMIDAVGNLWPKFAYWLATGLQPKGMPEQITPELWRAMNSGYELKSLFEIEPTELTEEQVLFMKEMSNIVEADRIQVHMKVRSSGKKFIEYYKERKTTLKAIETINESEENKKLAWQLYLLEEAHDAWLSK